MHLVSFGGCDNGADRAPPITAREGEPSSGARWCRRCREQGSRTLQGGRGPGASSRRRSGEWKRAHLRHRLAAVSRSFFRCRRIPGLLSSPPDTGASSVAAGSRSSARPNAARAISFTTTATIAAASGEEAVELHEADAQRGGRRTEQESRVREGGSNLMLTN
jgi:hypothetical protein